MGDQDLAKRCLETIGYYRLSAYWLPFEIAPEDKQTRSKQFNAETTFEEIYQLYIFDRKLRMLILEAIERVEIHLRSRWTYKMAHSFGPHVHLDHTQFSNGIIHAEQVVRLARTVAKSEETFILHYKSKYTTPYSPPLWAITELMTLGELSVWYQATRDSSVKGHVANELGLPTKEVCEGVLQCLSYVRNICAHHGRLWNRRLVKRIPKIKRFREDLVLVENAGSLSADNSIYNVVIVLTHMLNRQNVDNTFTSRLTNLLNSMPEVCLHQMGFPPNWRERPAFIP